MRVQKIQNVSSKKFTNVENRHNVSKIHNINFQANAQRLTALSADSFKSESAKLIFLKVQKYYKLLGEYGNIKDVKILHEKLHSLSSRQPCENNVEADLCLEISKMERNSNLKLYHQYINSKKKNVVVLDATFNKNGQMINGAFLPAENLLFERSNNNARQMYSNFHKAFYSPNRNRGKDWLYLGSALSSDKLIEESEKGVFEIFLELAKLRTSII